MIRRTFIKNTTAVVGLGMLHSSILSSSLNFSKEKIRVGVIGVGARGLGTLGLLLFREDVEVIALADIDPKTLAKANKSVEKMNKKLPKIFSNGPTDYKNMLALKELDAVFICTPWEWHTPISNDAMNAGKAVACEVAGAMSLEECWSRVRTYERTKTPFMVMENVNYRRDVMAVLNMVRQNMFGELVHLEGGYQHDLREVKFNDGEKYYGGGVEFGEKGYSEAKWRTNHSVFRNGDIYPTHGIGTVGCCINLNRGNRFEYLTSMASKSRGLHDYVVNHPKGGKDHPNAKVNFRLGDVVTTNIMTTNGESITLFHDTNLPRPYSLGFRVQGTKGLWMDINKSLHIDGVSPAHKWEDAEPYLKKYDHPLWKKYEEKAAGAGHGGMDWFVINAFLEALKRNEPMPLDVYDYASYAAITCLSEQSITEGGQPQYFPDFTNGQWINRKPIFAMGSDY